MTIENRTFIEKVKDQKKEILSTGLIIVVLFSVTFGGFYLLQLGLGTESPLVVVTSGSMEPTIYRGDMLIIQQKAPLEIKNASEAQGDINADIIVYWAQGVWKPADAVSEPIVHRVVGKKYEEGKWWFLAQGDNTGTNPYPDNPSTPTENWIPEENIIGIVIGKIPYVGHIKLFLEDQNLIFPLMVGLSVLLILSIIYDITHPEEEEEEEDKRKNKKKDQNRAGKLKPEQPSKQINENDIDFGV